MTDIIEDAQNILQYAIDYLTVILNSLRRKVQLNRHRPLNRQTLVRWLAAFYPVPKDPRIRVQVKLGSDANTLSRWGSCGSLRSSLSSSSLNQWVEEDLGENIVRFRRGSFEEEENSRSVFEDSNFLHQSHFRDMITSTPNVNTSCTSSVSNDFAATSRIAEMEEELSTLRKQIALLVMAQESSSGNKTVTGEKESAEARASKAIDVPLPSSPSSSASPDSGCGMLLRPPSVSSLDEMQELVSFPPCPPPPPPPPPPPAPAAVAPAIPDQNLKIRSSSTSSFADILKQKKNDLSRTGSDPTANKLKTGGSESVPDLAHVLKDLASVRLRAVDRSPGGTPLRQKPRHDPTDPASIIAQALKRKFANQMAYSPDSDKENEHSFNSPESSSPLTCRHFPFSKRRLSLLKEDSSDNWTPVASPLKPLNT